MHIGDIYGIYEVIKVTNERGKDGHRYVVVKCIECGAIRKYLSNVLTNSDVATTCKHPERFGIKEWNIKDKRLKNIFRGMCHRCYNKKCKDYKNYGAKDNVYIYKLWLKDPSKFEKWAKKNGYKKNLTIDRIDPDGPYAPWNCRWITLEDNSKYKSTTTLYTVDGITDTGKGWANRLGVGINLINRYRRIYGRAFVEHYLWSVKNEFKVLVPRVKMKGILF